jgi:hypothetical protein
MICPPVLRLAVLLLLSIGVNTYASEEHKPPLIQNMPPDGWGGAKSHFGYSAAIGAFGTAIAPEKKWWVLGGCLAVGVLKEYKDYRKETPGYRHGLFSRNDLKMDAAGCLAGVGGVTLYQRSF